MSPGSRSDDLVGTFSGGRYSSGALAKDTVLYRAGPAGKPLGQFFTREPPAGLLQTRIDQAVLPEWPNGGNRLWICGTLSKSLAGPHFT